MSCVIESQIKDILKPIIAINYPNGVTLKINYSPGEDLEILELGKRHRKKTEKFRVKYCDNIYSCDGRYEIGVRVLADVILRAGPAIVENLGIKTSGGLNLIQTEKDIITNKGPKLLEDGFWFISKTATTEKQNQIRQIIEKMNKKWTIERESD